MHHPTDRITYITAFVTPVVEQWLEQKATEDENKKRNVLFNDTLDTFNLWWDKGVLAIDFKT